jgi:hypothetical protein
MKAMILILLLFLALVGWSPASAEDRVGARAFV